MATAVSSTGTANDIYAAINAQRSKGVASQNTTVSDAQNRFLKLLTAQLRNQDPLNPLDNAQMTSQLAQISTVDGIERLNTTLQTLLTDSSNNQALQAAAMVGHGVLVPGNGMGLANGSAWGGIDLAKAADSVTIAIVDSNGLPIRTINLSSLDAGTHTFNWDGKTDDGIAAADGNYSFSVTAKQGGENVDITALQLGLVTSITKDSSGLGVNVGQQRYALSDVRQIL